MMDLNVVNVLLKHYRTDKIDKKTVMELLNDIKAEEGTEELNEVIFLVEGRDKIKLVKTEEQ